MTGHFFCVGTPEEIEFKSYGSEGKELAKWKFGYQRFQTFSESSMAVLREATGLVMCAGEFREREYEGKVYTDAHVSAVTNWNAKAKAKKQEATPPPSDSDLPF